MDARTVDAWRRELLAADFSGLGDEQRLDLLRSLEDLTRSAGAVTVATQVAFRNSQARAHACQGLPSSRHGEAVPDDLAHALRTSPHRASRGLVSARALVAAMPCTLGALRAGVIDAYQARLITEATACLSAEDRAEVDQRLDASLEGASTRRITAAARALVYEVDPPGM